MELCLGWNCYSCKDISDSDSSESEIITCTCGAKGRAHKRDCPLSSSQAILCFLPLVSLNHILNPVLEFSSLLSVLNLHIRKSDGQRDADSVSFGAEMESCLVLPDSQSHGF